MIVIHPFAQKLRNGMSNAKTFPGWKELIPLLGESDIIQLGVKGEEPLVPDFREQLPLKAITALVKEAALWVSIDSFLPHLAKHASRPGVVIWSVSDPLIFGYPENLNLLKDRRYLRANQFGIWEEQSFVADAFLTAPEIAERIAVWRAPKVRFLSGVA